jgi:hypothetical protein
MVEQTVQIVRKKKEKKRKTPVASAYLAVSKKSPFVGSHEASMTSAK